MVLLLWPGSNKNSNDKDRDNCKSMHRAADFRELRTATTFGGTTTMIDSVVVFVFDSVVVNFIVCLVLFGAFSMILLHNTQEKQSASILLARCLPCAL
jgi:hypothetical protein